MLCLFLLLALEAPQSKVAALTEQIEMYQNLKVFNGTVLVASGREIVLERGFGMANYELRAPHSPLTRFRVASVSNGMEAMLPHVSNLDENSAKSNEHSRVYKLGFGRANDMNSDCITFC